MTLREAAETLGVTTATLRQQIANGKLRATKRGRDWWVTGNEVNRYRRVSKRRRVLAPGKAGQQLVSDGRGGWSFEDPE